MTHLTLENTFIPNVILYQQHIKNALPYVSFSPTDRRDVDFLMDYYGIGELQFYIKKTDESLRKGIQLLLTLEQKIGGSTGELAAYRKTLKDIRCDIVTAHRCMQDKEIN